MRDVVISFVRGVIEAAAHWYDWSEVTLSGVAVRLSSKSGFQLGVTTSTSNGPMRGTASATESGASTRATS